MVQLLDAAERARPKFVGIADRAARLYAPAVHLLAAAAFLGWLLQTDGDWRAALFVSISVLIITCPCALGLAVPVVHVVAAGRLLGEGIMLKDGSGLERLADIDSVVFDKTGTLTTGAPRVNGGGPVAASERAAARALARHSAHPAARAISCALEGPAAALADVREVPGYGIEGSINGRLARLGRSAWVASIASGKATVDTGPAFAFQDGPLSTFTLSEMLRPGAHGAVAALAAAGLRVEILSGDGAEAVGGAARELGVDASAHGQMPSEKVARLKALQAAGHRVLMVGDGLNDTAALATAHVSMAPGSGSDAGRLAADFVFTGNRPDAVVIAYQIACRAASLVRQNFAFALIYNCLAIPFAVAGLVTPLVAALAMSASSILVVANALRLNGWPEAATVRSVRDLAGAAT